MSRPKPPETAEEYREHQRRIQERFVCDSRPLLAKEIAALRKALVVLRQWNDDLVADAIEAAIGRVVADELKELVPP